MVLSLLSLFTPMIRRLICLPNLLIVNALYSFIKTLVLSPWDDLFLSSSPLMHLHLVLCFALFNMFLFVCLFVFFFCLFFFFPVLVYFVFNIKKKKLKNQKKIQKQCVLCTLVLVYLGWPLKQSFLNFVSFVA